MDENCIRKTMQLAERFLQAAREDQNAREGDYRSPSPKHSGALRRASMDLTRALAEMRRPASG